MGAFIPIFTCLKYNFKGDFIRTHGELDSVKQFELKGAEPQISQMKDTLYDPRGINKKVVAVLILLFAFFFLFLGELSLRASKTFYINVVDRLPSGVRSSYINFVFEGAGHFNSSDYKYNALELLKLDLLERNNSYGFDYSKLVPLIKRGQGEEVEGVKQLSLLLIVLSNQQKAKSAVYEMYANDKLTLDAYEDRVRRVKSKGQRDHSKNE
ncbi:hypothetical protein ACJJIU_11250 [Microbulbifer sp. CnH-101-E]|uniref:hypothetical protein n=1 Tax=unclassified Microbulbifer TaxID=2619833 RepID=UPI00403A2514